MATHASDPRAATVTSVDGSEYVIVDEVKIDGQVVHMPRPLPGAAEFQTVSFSEARADELRPQLLSDLDYRGGTAWQPNQSLVLDMRASAGTAVASAMVGMEAFANHHIYRAYSMGLPVVLDGEVKPVEWAVEMSINERYTDVLPVILEKPKPTAEQWWPVFRRIQGLAGLQRHAKYERRSTNGLDGIRSYAQRIYTGEYQGAAAMMLSAFEYFSPGWLPNERIDALTGEPSERSDESS